ncbi:MAG: phage tail sheath subtilisin-like domain-containing protein [Dehalococcoidales bacterium]|nr:phage tail sheath subtilisin-like domain-containing protein [Dehalococcoidales bacterium]
MPEYLSPGVYVLEVDKGPKPIEGVGTAVAAFAGFAKSGDYNKPTLVTNWSQFVEAFGDFVPGSYLAHSVYGYFQNGGGRCFVTRLRDGSDGAALPKEKSAAAASLPGRGAGKVPVLGIVARAPAAEMTVEVAPPIEGGGEEQFTLIVRSGSDQEKFSNVAMGRGKGVRNVAEVVNKESTLVRVELKEGMLEAPAIGTYPLVVAPETSVVTVEKTTPATFVGDPAERSGIEGFQVAEEVTMVCVPDLMAAYERGAIGMDGLIAVQKAMIAHCELMKDRVAILDSPPGLTPQQMLEWRMNVAGHDSDRGYAALYYPWLVVGNPVAGGAGTLVPPSGYIAGIWARSDGERGVHKAPANEVVRGTIALEMQITKGEQDMLNPKGVNCIRAFPGRGIRVWGARTISSNPSWRYLNIRRLFNFVEESIREGTQWVVFEPNDRDLWERVKRDVGAFLTRVWLDGALFGSTPDEAFYVKCDDETNPPAVRDAGQLVVEVGIAPVKPAEFVIFKISQYSAETPA